MFQFERVLMVAVWVILTSADNSLDFATDEERHNALAELQISNHKCEQLGRGNFYVLTNKIWISA